MEESVFLDAIRRDATRMTEIAGNGLTAPVPSCPGWTVADVIGHTGSVHREKCEIVRQGLVADWPDAVRPPQSGVLEWFDEGATELVAVLAAADPAAPAISWDDSNQTVGFWYRRMAHETAVHRWDVELAHGAVTPVSAQLADDGVDELVRVFMTGAPEWAEVASSDRILRLNSADTDGSWTVRFMTFRGTSPHSGTTFEAEPALEMATGEPAATIRAPASDLLAYGWGRGSIAALEIEGDTKLVTDFRAVATASTQ